jgi:hypothetical protein
MISLQSLAQATVGLLRANSAEDGYILFAPIQSDTTYLIDKCGRLVHQWGSANTPGMSAYLLPDGSLLRSANVPNANFHTNGAAGGMIQKYDWDNNLLWSYTISSNIETQNHDIYPLDNGNVLAIIWEAIDSNTAIAAGRKPSLIASKIFSVTIRELQPIGTNQANVVWEWRLWDHLIQDFDSTKANYGIIADHPELINLNYTLTGPLSSDWIHANAVTYNAALDQILLSAHHLSELWFIDHSTTTALAATHAGGAHSHGGDLLYRWGNPAVYGRGNSSNRIFYTQHNPTWIPAGYPYANSIVVFNNGVGRPGGNASSVDIFAPPIDGNGNYTLGSGQSYGPSAPIWSYKAAPVDTVFYGNALGGVQPMANGNILICEGPKGNFFEIDSSKNNLWQYVNPVRMNNAVSQGTTISNNSVFRCTEYSTGYAAFSGRSLSPIRHIESNAILTLCDSALTGMVDQIGPDIGLYCFPNPASGILTIAGDISIGSIRYQIYDISGRSVISGETGAEKCEIDVSNFLSGLYVLNVISEKYKYQKKLCISH